MCAIILRWHLFPMKRPSPRVDDFAAASRCLRHESAKGNLDAQEKATLSNTTVLNPQKLSSLSLFIYYDPLSAARRRSWDWLLTSDSVGLLGSAVVARYVQATHPRSSTLQENICAVRAILDRADCITIPSHPASATIHLQIRWPTLQVPMHVSNSSSNKPSNPLSVKPRDPPQFDVELEERLLQDIVEEALSQGVMVTRAKRLRGQELVEVRPSIRLAVTAALSRKDCEKAASVVKAAFAKTVGRPR